MTDDSSPAEVASTRKSQLRAEMRALRRALPDRPERSKSIVAQLRSNADVRAAGRVMVFDSIPSEPDMAAFVAWCRAEGKHTLVPEDEVDPAWPDVVIVPGVAFTADGRRCGQGGGWYDQFLPATRSSCRFIGVCFSPQVVADIPTEPHDLSVHTVISA